MFGKLHLSLVLIFSFSLNQTLAQYVNVKQPGLMVASELKKKGIKRTVLVQRGKWNIFGIGDLNGGSMIIQSKEYGQKYFYVLDGSQTLHGKIVQNGRVLVTRDKDYALSLYKDGSVFDWERIKKVVEQGDPRIDYAFYGKFTGQGFLLNGVYSDTKIRVEGFFTEWGDISFGKISSPLHDTVYTGFIDPFLLSNGNMNRYYGTVGMRIKSYADTVEIIPFMQSSLYEEIKPFPESEYNNSRKYVIGLKWQNGIYEGEALNGIPEGLGIWQHDYDGNAAIGYYKNGYPHGIMSRRVKLPGTYGRVVLGLGLFKDGMLLQAASFDRGYYEGTAGYNFLANGKGKMWSILVNGEYNTEEGNFLDGQLHGYGKRTMANGSFQSGQFNNGVFAGGYSAMTHRGLTRGDVIRVNNKKCMVVETNRFNESNNYFVVLNDGSRLFESQPFTLTTETDQEFYLPCTKCSGSGSIISNFQTYSWLKNEYTESVKEEKNYGIVTKTLTITPKYAVKNHTRSATCTSCNGSRRLLKSYSRY
jgi:hypothetical protein